MFHVHNEEKVLSTTQDALVVGIFEENKVPVGLVKNIDQRFDGYIAELQAENKIHTSFKRVTKIHSFGKLPVKTIYFVGLGKKSEFKYEKARTAFAAMTKSLHEDEQTDVALALDTFVPNDQQLERFSHALAEAVGLASYRFQDYKEKKKQTKNLESVTVYTKNKAADVEKNLFTGFAYSKGTNLARTLVNTPGNLMTPTDLAAVAKGVADRHGMEFSVLEKEEMEKLGMGALLAVAQGSDQPPKMIVLKYRGKENWEDVLTFVGKGLTFDAGGISIKPSANMHEMKMDMGGGATVLGAMEVIGSLKPQTNVMAVIPATENLINGSALKPGDVITSLSGKTIEVLNTDAEGRLILCDAVTYAKRLGASYIVDVATLTGAVLIALGDCTTGTVTNNESFMENVLLAAGEAGEYLWRLPNFEPYKEMLKTSDVADLNNSPGRLGGCITAGLFVGEFAGETPWVHLDIAGTAWASKNSDLGPKGGTGSMVRTLATLAKNFS